MTTDKTSRKEKAAVRLAQEIVRAMYENGMRPGDKYFSEAEALQRHRVARATPREALRFLEIQGVITMRAGPGGGSVVGQPIACGRRALGALFVINLAHPENCAGEC
jgi:DNA-binding FadR family transcriptional regulator